MDGVGAGEPFGRGGGRNLNCCSRIDEPDDPADPLSDRHLVVDLTVAAVDDPPPTQLGQPGVHCAGVSTELAVGAVADTQHCKPDAWQRRCVGRP